MILELTLATGRCSDRGRASITATARARHARQCVSFRLPTTDKRSVVSTAALTSRVQPKLCRGQVTASAYCGYYESNVRSRGCGGWDATNAASHHAWWQALRRAGGGEPASMAARGCTMKRHATFRHNLRCDSLSPLRYQPSDGLAEGQRGGLTRSACVREHKVSARP